MDTYVMYDDLGVFCEEGKGREAGAVLVNIFHGLAVYWHDVVNQQKRKNFPFPPYSTHPRAVEAAYRDMFPHDFIGRAACWGHDLLEDIPQLEDDATVLATQASEMLLPREVDLIGADNWSIVMFQVVRVIRELTHVFTATDYPDRPRAERKTAERNRLMFVSERAHNIKACDVLHNAATVPEDDFGRLWLSEASDLLAVLRKADVRIKMTANIAVAEARLRLCPDAERKNIIVT